ncbi:FAD binding domain-containing protein [Cristinia sonorae]|uniref:FAD binding domain-containing protein n=1 Tax=Cristinia sonorae TaxID=1940300 RepID=A0A8K0UGV5_9AGAR|nr:FAD binding domain-containing protein [Cristinia sonorae]
MTIPESKVDVLIIGAGPAGLFAAHGLVKAGVNVRIVDQRPIRVAAGQADGIQPRTIEVLQSYGLAERLLREGNQMHMAAFYNPGPNGGIERTGRASDVTASSARWPFEVTLHQGAIESIFLDPMRGMGLEVDRPIVPTSLELSEDEALVKDPQAYPVKVTLKHLDAKEGEEETEVVHAKFVIGSDGAHSWVRKTLGVTMDGEQTDFVWGVVDIVPSTDMPDIRNKTAIHSPNGSCMIIPREGDKVRLYIQLSEKDVEKDIQTGRVDKSKVGPQQLLEVARKTFHPYHIDHVGEIDWWTIYVIGQRVASQFSLKERVFIAGDACHTHSPKAGQGMNASMNDSHNLVWKLTHVLRGNADLSLLKTYEFERRKYAQDLIAFDKKFSSLFSGKPRTEENQDGVSHEDFLQAFQTFGMFSSGIGIHYAPSAITNPKHQSLSTHQLIGTRVLPQIFIRAADARPYEIQDLLPADTKFKVLVFAGDTSNPEQLERVNRLAKEISEGEQAPFLKTFKRDPELFDVWSISSAKKEAVNYTDLPEVLRPHWSHVLLDDTDMYARSGGGGYERYGIDPVRGAVVVVRPDGYVGIVSSFEDVKDIYDYFSAFLKVPS